VNLHVNVGVEGGDLAARRLALVVMILLTALTLPWLGLPYTVVKITALLGAMTGTLFLMGGLVFLQKTHYAGFTLIPGPLAVMGLSSLGWRWAAVLLGLVVIAGMVQNLVTRSCGINRLLGINSCTCDT
jgi:hypothetical protein